MIEKERERETTREMIDDTKSRIGFIAPDSEKANEYAKTTTWRNDNMLDVVGLRAWRESIAHL